MTSSELSNSYRKPGAKPVTALLFLMVMSIGLVVLPRPTVFYPNIVVDGNNGTELNFLLAGRQDKIACEVVLSSIMSTITSTCRECSIRESSCVKNLNSDFRRIFSEDPLSVPSARLQAGVISYSGVNLSSALEACQESERQARLGGFQAKMICYSPGVSRPYSDLDLRQNQSTHTIFTAILAAIGVLMAGLVCAIGFAHAKQRVHERQFAGTRTIHSHSWLHKFVLAGVDVLILTSTFVALSWPVTDNFRQWTFFDQTSVIGHALVVVLIIGWFWILLEHYSRRRPFWDELREIFRVLLTMFMVSGAVAFVAGLETGRLNHLVVWILNFALVPLGRIWARKLLIDLCLWDKPALIFGTGGNARAAYLAIKSEEGLGYRIMAFVKMESDAGELTQKTQEESTAPLMRIGKETFPIVVLPNEISNFPDALIEHEFILALESLVEQECQVQIQRLLSTRNNIHIIPAIRGLPLFGTKLSHFFSHEVLFLTVQNNLSRRSYIWIKRFFDLVLAGLLIISISPLFLILSILIRRDGAGALYQHMRVGKNGRLFACLKFRSMRPDADKLLAQLLASDAAARKEWNESFKLRNDPRISPIGRFLRSTSLDELPQLINVLKGEMSLVGPRPVVEDELRRYGENVNLYLQVRPGMTGLWQVSGRSDTGYAERVGLDAWYVRNWSLWYDIAILFKTIGVVLSRRGSY